MATGLVAVKEPQEALMPSPQATLVGKLTYGEGYGSVAVGANRIETITLINNGTASVTVSKVTYTDGAFSTYSPTLPLTLPTGSAMSLQIKFMPTVVKPYSANCNVYSNIPTHTFVLTGTGIKAPATQHSVNLTWNASTSPVNGYNVYRGIAHGGPYSKLNAGLVTPLTYTDSTVSSGQTYYYVTTAVDAQLRESPYSNEFTAGVAVSFFSRANIELILLIALVLAIVIYFAWYKNRRRHEPV